MKRRMPAMLLLIGSLSLTQAANAGASPGKPEQSRVLARQAARAIPSVHTARAAINALRTMRGTAGSSDRASSRRLAPMSLARASGTDLALPADVVSAGNGVQGEIGPNTGVASTVHTTWAGYTGGVQATFDFKPTMTLGYRGSVFDNAQDASTYANDGYKTAAAQPQAQTGDCSSSVLVPCKLVSFTGTSGSQSVQTNYDVATVNECVIEISAVGDPTLMAQKSDSVNQTMAAVFVEGIRLAQQTCHMAATTQVPPSISIVGVGLGHTVKGQAKLTKSLKSGEKGIFILNFEEENAGTSTPDATVTFVNHGKKMGSPVDMQLVREPNGSLFFDAVVKFTAKKVLHVQAQFTANLGASSDAKTLDFTVTPKKK
jgi:hypothetical protein